MEPAVADLAADSGPLLSVSGVASSPGRFGYLQCAFGAGVLILRCDDDTDEIIAEVGNARPDCQPVAEPDLTELLGKSIEHAWELRNHRGYEDAFQLRLIAEDGREETRQFEVAASATDTRRVSP
jgi:hypothetical protein